ncbi:MAG: response regulator [Candidatus Riflebacteria bacterium]|nr:response regulator [Candidatus Riflebacteria bacterium]
MAKRVMIVDDAAVMRIMLKQLLTKSGYEVAGEAANGADAVAKYPVLKPDFVTMDITMPDMDGIEAVKEILKLDPNAKIIMCSAMGTIDKVKAAILAGAKSFLVKPLQADKVVATLQQVLGQ